MPITTTMIGTSACLKPNEMMTIENLLHGMMLPSGNDAAQTMAVFIGFHLF